jgi:hypothetical protein
MLAELKVIAFVLELLGSPPSGRASRKPPAKKERGRT